MHDHLGEEISFPVIYQGRQIQLTGWLEKPATAGPFPVVIVLHSCSGFYANMAGGSLPGWVVFLQQQGCATFKFDSFTARGCSEVCESNAVTAGDRAAGRAGDLRVYDRDFVVGGRFSIERRQQAQRAPDAVWAFAGEKATAALGLLQQTFGQFPPLVLATIVALGDPLALIVEQCFVLSGRQQLAHRRISVRHL